MVNKERQQEILSILKMSKGFVTVKQLCGELFASESSIRRDLKSLESQGLVKRSYGGASLIKSFSGISAFSRRTQQNVNAKRLIAKKAATLIEDGNIIFLDQSSTAFYLADEIKNRSSLTVVTNNIEIMMLLSGSEIKLISSGGFLSSQNRNCLIGASAAETFQGIFADIMFFSVKSLSSDGVVSDCSAEETAVRNVMLKNANKRVLLCDSTKFGTKSPFKQCDLGDVDYLISEENHAQDFEKYSEKINLV